jgi:predicted MPP superfamily phosphohydrolase
VDLPNVAAPCLVAAIVLATMACVPSPRPFAAPRDVPERGRFVVVGDLQRTSLLEFWREQNDAERARIVAAIAIERPDFVAMTGDLVFDGSSSSKWAELDLLAAPLHDAGIPAVAVLGNHEYWGGRLGERGFFARFPHLEERQYYELAYGPIRLVFVNSNVAVLEDDEWDAQRAWYDDALRRLDGDDDVRGVVVLMHHPAYTNSTVTNDEPQVLDAFVPAFMRAKKTMAMLAGHVHSYER